jgi:hypothetical protein
MPRVELQPTIEIDLEDILQGIAQLEIGELEKFTDRVMDLRASRRAPRLSKQESDLLQKINQGLSAEAWQRYDSLNEKLHEETISPEEHQEFLKLVEQIEMADAERLFHLIELSRIRRVSVDALMDQLGLRRSVYA